MDAISGRQLLFIAAALSLVASVVALILARAAARGTGFRPMLRSGSTLVASDTGAGPSLLLTDAALGLRGRPDYLLEEKDGANRVFVPVEVKPSRKSERLYESDVVQLGAYLIAARATFGDEASPFGFMRYSNRAVPSRTHGATRTARPPDRVRDSRGARKT